MRFAVVGHPIAHSRSPAMHTAAYRGLGLEHVYEKIDTPHDQLAHRVAELRHHDLDGLNVTVPHKQAVLTLVDEVAPSATAIGAANTLVRTADGRIVAHNTDAPALAEEIARLAANANRNANANANAPLAGKSAIVIGSGGAARAAVFALGALGISSIAIRARRPLEDAEAIAWAGARASLLHEEDARKHDEPSSAPHREASKQDEVSARPPNSLGIAITQESLGAPPREREDLAVIVQCTTAGMEHGAPGEVAVEAVAWDSVPNGCVAYDVVYAPLRTPFLSRAEARGLVADSGLGMLVAQGAIAFELWLGLSPPRDAMRAALGEI